MKHGLIFDLDGTLVDSLQGIAASLNHVLAEHHLPTHSLPAVRGFIGDGARILIRRAAPPDADPRLLLSLEQGFKENYEVTWPTGTTLYAGIAELLGTLQSSSYPLAVLSNKPHPFTTAIVSRLFPEIHFTTVLGQRPDIPHKPDPAGAQEIAGNFSLPASECTLIGDSTMDIQTAHRAGMQSIAVDWGFHDRQHLATANPGWIASNPAEIADFFVPKVAPSQKEKTIQPLK